MKKKEKEIQESLKVECPYCGAKPQEQCTYTGGNHMGLSLDIPHYSRIQAIHNPFKPKKGY